MSDLLVIVPSRGRPHNIRRLQQAWEDTGATADLLVPIDDDDPCVDEYPSDITVRGPRQRFGPSVNDHAVRAARSGRYKFIGSMGDDHIPRTPGWDAAVCSALEEMSPGIVYPDDLWQREALSTVVFMSASIINATGSMCPAGLIHMFIDNVWMQWGRLAGCLRYLPEVVIEHMHPHAAKADHDASYLESQALMGPDQERFAAYEANGMAEDVERIKALL